MIDVCRQVELVVCKRYRSRLPAGSRGRTVWRTGFESPWTDRTTYDCRQFNRMPHLMEGDRMPSNVPCRPRSPLLLKTHLPPAGLPRTPTSLASRIYDKHGSCSCNESCYELSAPANICQHFLQLIKADAFAPKVPVLHDWLVTRFPPSR